jgi:uncharacterized protein YbjT (DUF2867 family)
MKKIILVTGATGAQGNSVAKALLAENRFAVRILTRNAMFPKAIALRHAGAEVIEGDMKDFESLKHAMRGCYGVFGVTNYWEHFEEEYQLGKNLLEAVRQSGIQHFVFSTLENYCKLSGGKYAVPHYDIKATLQEYAKELSLPATFVQPAFYYENFLSVFPLQPDNNGAWYFGFPQGDARLATISVKDLGGIVATIFMHPDMYMLRVVRAVGDDRSCAEYASILSRVLGRRIYFKHIPREVYAGYDFVGAEQVANTFEIQRLHIRNRTVDLIETYGLNPMVQSFESWVIRNKEKFEAYFKKAQTKTLAA